MKLMFVSGLSKPGNEPPLPRTRPSSPPLDQSTSPGASSKISGLPSLLKSRPAYDPVADLDTIAGVATYPLCIAVQPLLPVATLKELVAFAKGGTGRLSYGHAGVGSIQHLTGELFKSLTQTSDIVHVPCRGTGPAITDLIGGQIPMAVLGLTPQAIESTSRAA